MDHKKKNVAARDHDEYPQFFDVFLPKYNSKRMRIPNAFVKCLSGRVLKEGILKSPKGKLWHVKISNINGGMYIEHGWERFTKDNSIQVGYLITFSFDDSTNNNTFNFKIYTTNRCEMIEETSIAKEEEEEAKGNDDSAEEKVDDDVKQEKEEEKQVSNTRSRKRKDRLSCGIDAELYVEPDNPYFLTKVGGNRKNELYIPSTVIRDFSLRLQEQEPIIFLERCCKRLPKHEVEQYHQHHQSEKRRAIKGKIIKWKDGRMCVREWGRFWRSNRISEEDVCLCEFLLADDGQTNTLLVHIVGIN